MQLGLTAPNRAWDAYTPAELAAIDDLAPGVLVVLLYGSAIDQTHAAQLKPFLDRVKPRLLLRPYRDDIPTIPPAHWATACVAQMHNSGLAGDGVARPPTELIPSNEMNLAIEHGSEDWPAQIAWLKAFAAAWRTVAPGVALHLPALSPSGNWLAGLAAYAAAKLDLLFDRIDVHAYDAKASAIVARTAALLRGPLDLTEYNRLDPQGLRLVEPLLESATWFLLGGTPDQAAYDLLRQPEHYASFKGWRPVATPEFTSPNHDGRRLATVGLVMHATLGPSNSPEEEYWATITWFQDHASQASAHAVVGPGGKIHRSVRTEEIAWHCRASNGRWLGMELSKPFSQIDQPIGDDILDAAARLAAAWCHDFKIPLVWSTTAGLAEHHEMPTNTDGHRDVGGPFDRADFLARIKRYSPQGADDLTNEQKKAVLDDLDLLWGMTRATTIQANPAESERACHERIVALKVTLGLNG